MSQKAQQLIKTLNVSIRNSKAPFDQIMYSLLGWAECIATEQFDSTADEILSPELMTTLASIKAAKGDVNMSDFVVLVDNNIIAMPGEEL